MGQTRTLLEHLRAHLVEQDIGRLPGTNDPSKPPIWLSPRFGLAAPGELPRGGKDTEIGPEATIGLFEAPGIAPNRHEGFMRTNAVDVRIRTLNTPPAMDIDIALRASLSDRRGWDMDGQMIQESLLWRDMQPLFSDENGWTFVTAYLFIVFEQDYVTF